MPTGLTEVSRTIQITIPILCVAVNSQNIDLPSQNYAESNALDEYALKMDLDIENGALGAEYEQK